MKEFFYRLGEKLIRKKWICIISAAIITLASLPGLTMIKMDTSVEKWFREDSEIFSGKEEFRKYFGNSEIIGIHIKASDIFEYDILKMIDSLGEEIEREVPFVDKLISVTNAEYSYSKGDDIIIEDLVPEPVPQSPQARDSIRGQALSKESFRGTLVSEDSEETWIIIRLKDYPENYMKENGEAPENVVGKKILEVLSKSPYKGYQIRPVGMPVMGYQELLYTTEETSRLTGLSMLAAIILLAFFLRSVRGVVFPFIITVISVLTVFGIMGYLGISVNAFLASVPVILAFAVSIGYSIHFFNYFRRYFHDSKDRSEAAAKAVSEAGWPVLFTALTTMGALVSFITIDLVPMRWLGLTSAALIFIIYVFIMLLLPGLLSFGKSSRKSGDNGERLPGSDRFLRAFGNMVLGNPVKIITVFVIVSLMFIYGTSRTKININTEHTYGRKVDYINSMLKVSESDIGSFSSYNVMINTKETEAFKDPENLNKLSELENAIDSLTLTKRTSSVLDILKDMNRLVHEGRKEYYSVPGNRKMAAQLLLLYEMSGGSNAYYWSDNSYSVTRIQVETKDLDAKETVYELEFILDKAGELFPGSDITITGGVPEFAALNQYIAKGQIKSFAVALTVITLLMMIVFKSVKTGLIGLIPNITPAIAIGGVMGLSGTPLDFLTVTLAPMILGLAVDDTIHFIESLKTSFEKTGNYHTAAINAFKTVGRALFMTSAVIIVSFSVYLSSEMNMFFNLGIFIILGIAAALAADYFITPVLCSILEPFGKGKNNENRI
ncbi:MAG: efflux RND transporter permease subunit [Fibrobacterota bacterium]